MLDVMTQAANAIEAYNSALSIHSANIANLSVTGYKRLDTTFESLFERLINGGTPANGFSNLGGTNPFQLGQGVAISSVGVDMSQGNMVEASSIDVGVDGRGLLIVSSDGGNTYQYTRAGKFAVNTAGSLVTASGQQVYGFSSSGGLAPITGLSGAQTNYTWDGGGNLLLSGAQTGYSLALAYFKNPSGLAQASGTSFAETLASGPASAPMHSGEAAGTIVGGKVEQSNVFYLGETIDSLELQRAMSANLTTVRMASDIISQFISKLG
jgi:flagellar hook protein FlgE